MTCEHAREFLADFLAGALEPSANALFQGHLNECPTCRREAESMQKTWNSMENVPAPEPSPELRVRFHQLLDAYQQGQRDTASSKSGFNRWFTWWPQQPVMQFALSAAVLAIGIFAGHTVGSSNRGTTELTQLRGEMQNMRQLVTLSLLQQQSASSRLQGVNWSYRVEQSDMEVLAALLQTINHDQSVDVRLAAVDAVRNFADSPVARSGLRQALGKQTSPLVDIALVDLLVDLKDRPAAPYMQALESRTDLDPNVRKRIDSAVRQLN